MISDSISDSGSRRHYPRGPSLGRVSSSTMSWGIGSSIPISWPSKPASRIPCDDRGGLKGASERKMRLRSRWNSLLLTVTLSWNAVATSAAPIGPAPPRLCLIVHGTRALSGNGLRETGWGGGGAVRYAVSYSLRVWADVERVRTAHEGSFVSTVTPWTFGVEIGPRTPRRIEALFRLGLGMYRLERRGEYVNFFSQRLTQYSDSGLFSGLNFGGGGYARLPGAAILELSATFHQS